MSFSLTSPLLRRRAAFALVIGAFGCGGTGLTCCKPPEPDGLYIKCEGESADLYWISNAGKKLHEVTYCLDEQFLNETGVGGTEGEIDLVKWINDPEDIETLRKMCAVKCEEITNTGGHCSGEGLKWDVQNYKGQAVPDIFMYIDNPWHLGCVAPLANLASSPWDTAVVPSDAPPIAWPSTDDYVSVDCEDFGTCAEHFVAPIGVGLYHDDTAEIWGSDMGYADYLATTSTASSRIEITLLNPGGTPSSDTHEVDGRIEYSMSNCGETECPFYLANLTLFNTEDTWQLNAEGYGDNEEGADVYLSNISLQLRRPTLGVWNNSTSQVYLGAERVDIYVLATHRIGSEPPMESGYLVTNADVIFGKIDDGGGITVSGLIVSDGAHVEIEADLVYDKISGEPPTANNGLGDTVIASTDAGIPLTDILDASSDPDNDIDSKIWFIDGVEQLDSYIVPLGGHEFTLRVIDGRGATDLDASVVEVLAP